MLDAHPVVDMIILLVKMIADMLEAHDPCTLLYTILLSGIELRNERITKATPKVLVAFSTEVH